MSMTISVEQRENEVTRKIGLASSNQKDHQISSSIVDPACATLHTAEMPTIVQINWRAKYGSFD